MIWIKSRIRELTGKTQTGLATAMGVDPSRITEIVKGDRQVKSKEVPALAEYLELPLETVMARIKGKGDAAPDPIAEQPLPNAVIAPDAARPPLRQDMPKDVPVYGTGQGGDGDGDFELNGQIVDYVRRPPRIAGRRDVFAIYLQGRSMWPWRDSGQLVYAETARAAKNLDFVIVEMKPTRSDDVRPALVKRLLAVTPNKVKLEQFNPAKTIEIDGRKILKIYRIMDWDELLGV